MPCLTRPIWTFAFASPSVFSQLNTIGPALVKARDTETTLSEVRQSVDADGDLQAEFDKVNAEHTALTGTPETGGGSGSGPIQSSPGQVVVTRPRASATSGLETGRRVRRRGTSVPSSSGSEDGGRRRRVSADCSALAVRRARNEASKSPTDESGPKRQKR